MLKLALLISIIWIFVPFLAAQDLTVTTVHGQVSGAVLKSKSSGRNYYSFQAIPYAAPPTGSLRFKAPQPPSGWNGVRDASKDLDVMCYQTFLIGYQESEDCLFLNVFTPELPNGGNNPNLPVIYFVNGNGFVSGPFNYGFAFTSAYSPDLLVDEDVIVVTANYRLGLLGFLSTEDEVIPGNFGLKDQRAVLRWIRDNIAAFGGDPQRVTIYGQGAGAISVSYQLLDTSNEGYFHAAILESGSALMPSGYQRNARDIAFGTGAVLDSTFATNRNSQSLLNLLNALNAEHIDDAAAEYLIQNENPESRELYEGLLLAPVIERVHDEASVTEKMYGAFRDGRFVKVPILAGINSEESLDENYSEDSLTAILSEFDQNLDYLAPDDMLVTDVGTRTTIGTQIRNIYTNGGQLQNSLGRGLRLISDHSYNKGIIKQASFTGSYTPTYFYQFSYDGSLGGVSVKYEGADNVAHNEDLMYLWNVGCNANITWAAENDQLARRRLIQLWTDFAKTGNPTPSASDVIQNIIWPDVNAYNNGSFAYLNIDVNLEIRLNPKNDTLLQWDELYDALTYQDFDTY